MQFTDTERLDYLIAHWHWTHISYNKEKRKWIVWFSSSPISEPHDNLRDAIDEAMENLIKKES